MDTLKGKKNKTNYSCSYCSFVPSLAEQRNPSGVCLTLPPANQNQGRFSWALLLPLLANTEFSFKLWLKPCWGRGPGPFLMSFSHGGASLTSAGSPWLEVSRTGTYGTISKDLWDLSIKQTRLLKLFGCFQSKARTSENTLTTGPKGILFSFFSLPSHPVCLPLFPI